MKKQNIKFINFIGKDEMDNLTSIVKETLPGINGEYKKFTDADFWVSKEITGHQLTGRTVLV